jgi:hypothetical protein
LFVTDLNGLMFFENGKWCLCANGRHQIPESSTNLAVMLQNLLLIIFSSFRQVICPVKSQFCSNDQLHYAGECAQQLQNCEECHGALIGRTDTANIYSYSCCLAFLYVHGVQTNHFTRKRFYPVLIICTFLKHGLNFFITFILCHISRGKNEIQTRPILLVE